MIVLQAGPGWRALRRERLLGFCLVAAFAMGAMVPASASSSVGVWGLNRWGSLGTGSSSGPEACNEVQCTTVPVGLEGLTGVSAIAAADYNGMVLLSSETVEDWGSNYSGQLGDGTHTGPETCPEAPEPLPCSTKPVAVKGLTEAAAVATSGEEYGGHSVAALRSGKVVDWGNNEYGDLGIEGANATSLNPFRSPA